WQTLISTLSFRLGMKGLDYVQTPAKEDKWQFNGKEKQTELGLHHYDFSARSYDYQTGRTTTLDSHGDRYVSVSPYSFLNNNPLRYIDPTGRDGIDMYYDEEKEKLIQEGFDEFIQYLQNGDDDDDDKKKRHKNSNSNPNDGRKDKGKKQKDFTNKVNDFVKNNHHKYKVITFSIFEGRVMVPIGWSSLTFSGTIALGYDGVNFGLLITPTAGIGLGIGDTYGVMGSINFFKANSLEDISGLGLNIGGFINALSIVDFSFELNAAVDLVNIDNWYGGLGIGNPINAGSWGKGAGAYIDAGWTFIIPIYQSEQIPEYLQGHISQSVLKEGFNTIKSIYPHSSNQK
ncbi:RHS repeat domain-containing protein, partial [Thermoflexibacter ruber]